MMMKQKPNNLSKIFGQTKNKIVQDVPSLFSNTFKKKGKIKLYKNNIFFKKILISWPQIFGTSTISCSREILDKFFKPSENKISPTTYETAQSKPCSSNKGVPRANVNNIFIMIFHLDRANVFFRIYKKSTILYH